MAKTLHNDVFDNGLVTLQATNLMTACNAQPTTRTEAVTTFALADILVTGGTDVVISDGDTNGRKARMAAKTGVTVDASGTATHIALTDATRLLLVTECTSQVLTAGNTINFPAFDYEIADPV